MTEAYLPVSELIPYYGKNFTEHAGDISHMPLNFGLIENFKSEGDVTADKVGLRERIAINFTSRYFKSSASFLNFSVFSSCP